MQQYRKDAKRHMSDDQYRDWRDKRSKKLCRGGKPHDYVLVLPYGYEYKSLEFVDPKTTQEVYDSMDRAMEFKRLEYAKLEALGVHVRYGQDWRHARYKKYMCSVCKKEKSAFDKN